MENVTIRAMRPSEEPAVAQRILRSFRAAVSSAYSSKGVAEFERIAAPEEVASRSRNTDDVLVAETGGSLVGMVEVRQKRHISMLFVVPACQRRGIGRSLLEKALPALHFAFEVTGSEQAFRGIRFVPMSRNM